MTDQVLNIDKNSFLSRYWQREHLLVRAAIANFQAPVDGHELAGLAMEESVESRIIEQRDLGWHLLHGPFSESDFQREQPWTLLVQAVDHYLPAVAALRRLVDFIPQWRVDDVMVSYAVDGGGVGPHYDNYDVFLLQGEGKRHWRIGQRCDGSTPLSPNPDLRIVRDFQTQAEYTLAPGDLLYIPPGLAHWGVARGECTTFSIGFRAPRVSAMVSRWADRLLEQMDPEQFYSDAQSEPAPRPGEIRPGDIERARTQLAEALQQATGDHWFGELVTEPRYDCAGDEDELAEARALLQEDAQFIELSPTAKLAWQDETVGVTVFANGECLAFSEAIRETLIHLCGRGRLEGEELARAMNSVELASLLEYLLQCGCIYVE